jgi:hypothetical protein
VLMMQTELAIAQQEALSLKVALHGPCVLPPCSPGRQQGAGVVGLAPPGEVPTEGLIQQHERCRLQLETAQRDLASAAAAQQRLTAQLSEAQSAAADAQEEASELRKKLATAAADAEAVAAATAVAAGAKAALESAQQQLSDLRQQLAAGAGREGSLEAQVSRLSAQLRVLEQEHEAALETARERRGAGAAVHQEHARVASAAAQLDLERRQLRAQHAAAMRDLQEHNRQVSVWWQWEDPGDMMGGCFGVCALISMAEGASTEGVGVDAGPSTCVMHGCSWVNCGAGAAAATPRWLRCAGHHCALESAHT